MGGRGEVCSPHVVLSQPYISYSITERRYLKGGGKTESENLQNVSVRMEKGGDEAIALILYRSDY